MLSAPTRVTAVVLAFGDEPWLERSVDTLLASVEVDVDVVVVDNGGVDAARLDALGRRGGVRLLRPGRNLGFAGGCNAGARVATGDVVVFVNQDAAVEPKALAALAGVALRPGVGLATGSVRLADEPQLVNSAGNDIHYLGFSWSGGFRDSASEHAVEREVTGSSGTALAVRRALFEELGGFGEPFFAYHEDAELSLRCWQRGLSVVYVPDAVVLHRYEFSRNPRKYYLLERNRLLLLLTAFEARTLVLLAPALVLAELAIVALAVKQGWLRQKVAGWGWIVRNRAWVRERRATLRRERIRHDRDLVPLFVSRLDPGNVDLPGAVNVLNGLLDTYWRAVRRLLPGSPGGGG